MNTFIFFFIFLRSVYISFRRLNHVMKQGSRYFDFKSRFLAIAYVSPLPLRKAFFVCIAQVTDDDEIKKLIIF